MPRKLIRATPALFDKLGASFTLRLSETGPVLPFSRVAKPKLLEQEAEIDEATADSLAADGYEVEDAPKPKAEKQAKHEK